MSKKKSRKEKKKGKFKTEEVKELEEFKIHLLTNKKSTGTVRNYLSIIHMMLEKIKKPPRKISGVDLEQYKTYLSIEKDLAKNTMYINIKAIQSFFNFLGMEVASNMNPPKRPESLPKYLSEEEMGKMFEAAISDNINGIRDYAILVVLGYTGLRVSELCSLNTEDIDFKERTIKVLSGKGDKDRIVIFEEKTEQALRDHIGYEHRHISKDDPSAVFGSSKKERITARSIEYMVQKYAKKAGIEKNVTPHVLRHTMATTLLKRGADIRIIQQLLGHSSIATTQIYTHVDEGMLKKAYSKAKPQYK